jgi:D-alanine-D-alanine ligase
MYSTVQAQSNTKSGLTTPFLNGQAYLLDVNADATLHPQRSLAQVARAAGLSYTQLIEAILKTSLERWQTNFG